ncbi:MAG: TIGR01777 family protein [Chloroflexi bacterium]|nr:TIGR01777 family protein [Chloroflexota bacterium]
MKAIVTGSSGFLGKSLVRNLREDGAKVIRLVRNDFKTDSTSILWDPMKGIPDTQSLENSNVVFHVAGENLANGRWTASRKKRIRDSRVVGTKTLVDSLIKLEQPPGVLVCASAVGIYGDRPGELVTEDSPAGEDWISKLGVEWEASASPAVEAGIRTVLLRIGVVLHPDGGMLKRILLPFKMGVGGKLGQGTQTMSWVSLRDAIEAFRFCADNASINGPFNVCAPERVTNAEFTLAFGKAIRRPAFLKIPSFTLKLVFGEELSGVMLGGASMSSAKLESTGFQFRDHDLSVTLSNMLST